MVPKDPSLNRVKAYQLYVNKVENDVTDDTCRRCAEINVIKTKKENVPLAGIRFKFLGFLTENNPVV